MSYRTFRCAVALSCILVTAAAAAGTERLRETGSTLLLPLMSLWVTAYERAHPDVSIDVEGTGSGEGISQAMAGSVDIGASDAYLSDEQLSTGVLNIPLAVSAQVIAYNLQQIGDRHLNFSGDVLAGIYSGAIVYWDDPRIRALNSGMARDLPHERIVAIRRIEGSGDTFMFTRYLVSAARAWTAGYGTTVRWPYTPGMLSARGNSGMIDACEKNDGSIAYVAVSYLPQLGFGELGYAALRAHDGSYVLPTPETMSAAVAGTPIGQDGRASLIDRPQRHAYPIVTYEYAVVREHQGDAARARALKNFFAWAISPSGGNDEARFLSALDFVPLSGEARATSRRLIAKIEP